HAEEEKDDPAFAKQLASLADLYVNDAFGSAHRAHASVHAMVRAMGKGAAGLLMDKELKYLGEAVNSPVRPFVAIIGGAMAYTFFKSEGLPVGKSLVEDDRLEHAKAVTARAKERGVALELPVDH